MVQAASRSRPAQLACLVLPEAVLQTADLCPTHVDRVFGVPCKESSIYWIGDGILLIGGRKVLSASASCVWRKPGIALLVQRIGD